MSSPFETIELARARVSLRGQSFLVHHSHGGPDTVVFCHGWAGGRAHWAAQLSEFHNAYRVVAFDAHGHGENQSVSPIAWSVAGLAEDLGEVCRKLAIGRVALVGHSLGARVVAEAGAADPEQIRAVIGVEDFRWDYAEEDRNWSASMAAAVENTRTDLVRDMISNLFLEHRCHNDVARGVCENLKGLRRGDLVALMKDAVANQADVQQALAGFPGLKAIINSDGWRTTNVPRLQALGIALYTISQTGHYVMIEQPRAFNTTLTRILHAAFS